MRLVWTFIALLVLAVSPLAQANAATAHPEARPFIEKADASAAADAALSRAKVSGKRVIVVLGANWCHDSRGLTGWFATPRFAAMLKTKYEIIYVDVGMPQMGKGRNLDVAARFGIKKIKGTPTVMILSADGKLLNEKDAPTWRNAASRSEDEVFNYFNGFGEKSG